MPSLDAEVSTSFGNLVPPREGHSSGGRQSIMLWKAVIRRADLSEGQNYVATLLPRNREAWPNVQEANRS